MALLNLAMVKSKGNGALVRTGAFLCFALLLWQFKVQSSDYLKIPTGICVAGLLGLDVALKAKNANGHVK